MNNQLLALLAAAALAGCAADQTASTPGAAQKKGAPKAAAKPVIFNGKDLAGLKRLGGEATYAVKDGVLVGTSTINTPNTFLATEKEYSNFVLEYEFLNDPRLNSGVQFRSRSLEKESEFTGSDGKKKKVPAGRVHGYQAEIDTDPKNVKKAEVGPRMWSAGLYEEGRRGWI
ncbi:MAG: DUF1080 domain-containing protein, partial [Verrucomicrobiota bacterium]